VGRPSLPKGDAKARIVPVRFKPDEFKAISRAAKASKQSLSEWIRGTLNAKVTDQTTA
jgi:predicted HicB family RNase H-like nuclease